MYNLHNTKGSRKGEAQRHAGSTKPRYCIPGKWDDDCSSVTNKGQSTSRCIISELGFHSLGYLVELIQYCMECSESQADPIISFFLGATEVHLFISSEELGLTPTCLW